jgi:hypothetical protein
MAWNVGRETTAAELIAIEGLDEYTKRSVAVNLTGGFVNAVEICARVYKAPTFEVLLADFLGQALENEAAHAWHVDNSGLEDEDEEVSYEAA